MGNAASDVHRLSKGQPPLRQLELVAEHFRLVRDVEYIRGIIPSVVPMCRIGDVHVV